MSNEFNEKNYSSKMDKSIQSLKKIYLLFEQVELILTCLMPKVDVYGQLMPIDQLATISVPEARLVSVQVWDKANISVIESTIQIRTRNKSTN